MNRAARLALTAVLLGAGATACGSPPIKSGAAHLLQNDAQRIREAAAAHNRHAFRAAINRMIADLNKQLNAGHVTSGRATEIDDILRQLANDPLSNSQPRPSSSPTPPPSTTPSPTSTPAPSVTPTPPPTQNTSPSPPPSPPPSSSQPIVSIGTS